MSSNVLANVAIVGIEFDPSNKKHRGAYAYFTANTRWPDNVRFQAEWPNTSVVATVEKKLAMHAIRSELKDLSAAEAAA